MKKEELIKIIQTLPEQGEYSVEEFLKLPARTNLLQDIINAVFKNACNQCASIVARVEIDPETEPQPDSVDAELEEVRKAFPVDHYVRYVQGDFKSIRKIKSIERNAKNIIIVKYSDGGFDYIKDVELIPGSERVVVGSPDTDIMENVDAELEKAKKLFPVGRMVQHYSTTFEVIKVYRDEANNLRLLGTDSSRAWYLHKTNPHTLQLAPERDTELEEARKRFPAGSWFTYANCNSTLFKVVKVERDSEEGILVYDDTGDASRLKQCTPATLPTRKINWRCMKTDAPDSCRYVLVKIDSRYCMGWKHFAKGWKVDGVFINVSKHNSALWCELEEIEGV